MTTRGIANNFIDDAANNPTTFRNTGGLPYNADNQRTGPQTFAYDHNGNPTTYKGTSGLVYDAENHLVQYGTLTAGYNGDGLRAWKRIGTGGKRFFLYDGTNLLCEFDAMGNIVAQNTWGANGLVSRWESGSYRFYMYDPMGNVVNIPDGSNYTAGDAGYDAYGKPYSNITGPYGYGGQWGYYTDYDAADKLVLCTFRYYDPNTGRWLTRDPIGYDGGINLYGYVEGNPVNLADPEGLYSKQLADCYADCEDTFEISRKRCKSARSPKAYRLCMDKAEQIRASCRSNCRQNNLDNPPYTQPIVAPSPVRRPCALRRSRWSVGGLARAFISIWWVIPMKVIEKECPWTRAPIEA